MKIFSPDSKLMIFLTVLCDLMLIGILTLICCIPVITIGAALTAKDRMCYRVLKGEGSGVAKDFFISFKNNFRQATLIWIFQAVVLLFFVLDIYLLKNSGGEAAENAAYVLWGLLFFTYILTIMVYPVLARFENPLLTNLKNAVVMSMAFFPKALLMGILYLIPPVLAVVFPFLIPLFILFGLSGPGYLSAMMYRKTFEKLESAYLETLNRNSHFDEAETKTLGQFDE